MKKAKNDNMLRFSVDDFNKYLKEMRDDGYKDGYEEGYMDGLAFCVAQINNRIGHISKNSDGTYNRKDVKFHYAVELESKKLYMKEAALLKKNL